MDLKEPLKRAKIECEKLLKTKCTCQYQAELGETNFVPFETVKGVCYAKIGDGLTTESG